MKIINFYWWKPHFHFFWSLPILVHISPERKIIDHHLKGIPSLSPSPLSPLFFLGSGFHNQNYLEIKKRLYFKISCWNDLIYKQIIISKNQVSSKTERGCQCTASQSVSDKNLFFFKKACYLNWKLPNFLKFLFLPKI